MAKNTLPVNFQDDILNSAMDGKRRFKLIPNSDGTYSLEDATTYDQVGSNFGAGQINATNQAVNESADKNKVIQDIEAIRNVTEDGYIAGALALKHVDNSLDTIKTTINNIHILTMVEAQQTKSSAYLDIQIEGMEEGDFVIVQRCATGTGKVSIFPTSSIAQNGYVRVRLNIEATDTTNFNVNIIWVDLT